MRDLWALADYIEQIARDCDGNTPRRTLISRCEAALAAERVLRAPVPPIRLQLAREQLCRGEVDRACWSLRRSAVRLRRALRKASRKR